MGSGTTCPKRLRLLLGGLLCSAGVGFAQPASGTIWLNIPDASNPADSANMSPSLGNAQFTTTAMGIYFCSQQSQTEFTFPIPVPACPAASAYNPQGFLNNPTFSNTSPAFSPTANLNNSEIVLTGSFYLAPGANTFYIADDDYAYLSISGGPGTVTCPGTQSGAYCYQSAYGESTLNLTASAGGVYTYTIDYIECCGSPAFLLFLQANGMPVGNLMGLDTPFQVSYAANPSISETYINIINTGANGALPYGPAYGTSAGNICVNVYTFAPDEQEITCCSCLLTPNSVVNLGVNRDLTGNTLTGFVPTSLVIKLVATLAGTGGSGSSCTNSAAWAGSAAEPLVYGMVAYETTPQQGGGKYIAVEHRFTPATLSAAELTSIAGRCGYMAGNGSGFGVCNSCRTGALGATKQ